MKQKKIKFFLPRFFLILALGFCMPVFFQAASLKKNTAFDPAMLVPDNTDTRLYDSLDLESLGLSKEAFSEGVAGYRHLKHSGSLQNQGILSIVDFSLPSFRKRLFVIDLEKRKLLFNTLVAHGRNSGQVIATKFSNGFRSFESSLGFYVTGDPYHGHNGYSLHLVGMENGINNNALDRGIVVHAAPYVNEKIAARYGRLGRSEGCPAIPNTVHRAIIEKIKNGSCFFIYARDAEYQLNSYLLRNEGV